MIIDLFEIPLLSRFFHKERKGKLKTNINGFTANLFLS